MTRQEFIQKFFSVAQQAVSGTGILPGTVLSIAALESNNGNSQLSARYNNYFGLTPGSSWTGKRVTFATTEYVDGKPVTVTRAFRAYDSPEESFRDFVNVITSIPRYQNVLKQDTVEGQVSEIAAAGYATDPNYRSKVLAIWDEVKGLVSSHPGSSIAVILALIAFSLYMYFRNHA